MMDEQDSVFFSFDAWGSGVSFRGLVFLVGQELVLFFFFPWRSEHGTPCARSDSTRRNVAFKDDYRGRMYLVVKVCDSGSCT